MNDACTRPLAWTFGLSLLSLACQSSPGETTQAGETTDTSAADTTDATSTGAPDPTSGSTRGDTETGESSGTSGGEGVSGAVTTEAVTEGPTTEGPLSASTTCGEPICGEGPDECALGIDDCDSKATCTDTPEGFVCACNPGWTGDGKSCADEDECELGTDTCSDIETCENTEGSFECTCEAPSVICGQTCVDLDSDFDHCGFCNFPCEGGQICAEGVCLGSGALQITLVWSRPGDGDLMVQTPSGKLVWWNNLGPGEETDFGQMDKDDTSGMGPENVFWAEDPPPPPGEYHVCFSTSFFDPEPSAAAPIDYEVTVRRSDAPDEVFTGTVTEFQASVECTPASPGYVTSVEVL